jgi:type I restriction enzyme R subunit
VVLARVINSITEFKQIIGRGTRVREEYGKLFFTILDYTGSAMQRFADPDFDGDPVEITQEEIDADGNTLSTLDKEDYETAADSLDQEEGADGGGWQVIDEEANGAARKYYVDEGQVEIVAEVVYTLDADGRRLRAVSYTDYAQQTVRTLFHSLDEFQHGLADTAQRRRILKALDERGIDLDELRKISGRADADPFDLLCFLAYGGPIYTRRERAERLLRNKQDFFDRYGPDARAVLNDLLDKYIEHGLAQFTLPDLLKVPPISTRGNIVEIVRYFDDAQRLNQAVDQLQTLLYAA